MGKVFPHLNDTQFPNIGNVDVYKYGNEFDYTRYDYSQMDILVCSVPWDVGEARIGARTISGIGNVVYFDNKAERDKWFDGIPEGNCFRWSTKSKELHRSNTIDIPLPFDIAAKYNYVVVSYSLFANDGSPVEYEDADGLRKWFWFIREVEFLAPNTTRLHLLNDAWQTFIYDLNVSGMVLERGHAPMQAVNADSYLANPQANSANLLAPDYMADNAAYMAMSSGEYIFNAGDMKAVIISTAYPRGSFGSKAGNDWATPARNYLVQGAPSYYAFATDAENLSDLLSAVNAQAPQFMPTIKAVCFLNASLLSIGTGFEFCGIACNEVGSNYISHDVLDITKDKFGYADRYAEIAKLYTYPYSYIELSDGNGDVMEIRIETTNGKVTLDTCINLIYPFIKINGHVSSIGKASRKTVRFANVTERNMPISGNWYEYLQTWDIPTYGVLQQASTRNDYNTHFDRRQQATAYANAYDSSVATANTAQSDAIANADNITANATLTTTANTAITTASNASAGRSAQYTSDCNFDTMLIDNAVTNATATSEVAATAQQAAISASAAMERGIAGMITSALSKDPVGAFSSAVNGIIGSSSTLASSNVSIHLTELTAGVAQASNTEHAEIASTKTNSDTQNQQFTATAITNANNTLTSGQAANNSATIKANAARDASTETANAGRSRDTAQSAITNQIAQAALDMPEESGSFGYGDSATTRPVGAYANVITMDDYSIENVGDEFLRYGYMYGKQWDFDGNWNVCDKFTYWKLKDFWVTGLSIADMYVDKLRFFLFGGVTVWRRPEYIGNTSIYDNGL